MLKKPHKHVKPNLSGPKLFWLFLNVAMFSGSIEYNYIIILLYKQPNPAQDIPEML